MLKFLAFLYLANFSISAEIGIYSISTHPFTENYQLYGSMKGGTLLYIKGLGFDIFPANNYIMIGSKLCDIEYASENYIKCYTPEIQSNEKEVKVTVVFQNQNGEVISECWATTGNCTFLYKASVTPLIQGMYPRTVAAGDTLHMTGLYQLTSSAQYKSTKFYDRICQATNLNSLSYSQASQNTINCIISDYTPAGLYNSSVTLSIGNAQVSGYGITINENQLFDVRVIPKINEINGEQASSLGKRVEIMGVGFGEDQEAVSVDVEEISCEIKEFSKDKIVCQMPEISQPIEQQFKGNTGFKWNIYTLPDFTTPSLLRDAIISNTATLLSQSTVEELEIEPQSKVNYLSQMSGYFFVPRTGDYRFYVSCQGECEVYFQNDADSLARETMQMIASSNNTSRRYYFQEETQISEIVSLTEGNYHYMEVYHTKQQSGAQLTVSVEIPSNSFKINSIIEKVQLSVDSEIELEKFFLSLYGQTGGNWSILYLDYQNLQVSSAIPWNATCEEIVNEIKKFGTSVACEIGELDSEGNLKIEQIPEENTTTPPEEDNTTTPPEEESNTTTPPEEQTQTPTGGWIYNITFLKRRETEAKLVIQTANLTTITDGVITATSNWWNHASDPVTGTFTLSLNGGITQINCNASILEMQTAFINDLSMPETIEVVDDGGNIDDGLKWQIIFYGYEGDVPTIEISEVNLIGGKTGTTPTLTITTQVDGSLNQLYEPMPSDSLFNAGIYPQVKLTVNGFLSACESNCNYIIDPSITPAIDSYSLTSTGLDLTLSNADFFTTLTKDSFDIIFADSICTPTSLSLPSLSCTIPQNSDNSLQLSAGQHKPIVMIKEYGLLNTTALSNYNVQISISSILPNQGSPNGGQEISIVGAGFGEGIEIMLGSVQVTKILSITNTEILIMTPHSDSSQNSTISISLNSQLATSTLYSFMTTGLPTITSLSKQTASPMIKSNVVVSGSGFGSDKEKLRCILQNIDDESIYLELNVYSAVDNEVMCIIGGGVQGNYELNIIMEGIGYALVQTQGSNSFTFAIAITDYYPKQMGIYAGSKLVIIGSGFSSVLAQNTITIGEPNIYCQVISANSTQLICELAQDVDPAYLASPQQFHLLQRITELASCQVEGGCQLTFIEPILDCFEIINQ